MNNFIIRLWVYIESRRISCGHIISKHINSWSRSCLDFVICL